MNKTPSDYTQNPDDLLTEYELDYRTAKPNRFAARSREQQPKVVILDEDVAQVFTTSESVNKALRALIQERSLL